MRERVKTIFGTQPIILVAAHGADDTNTALLTELVATHLNCFAVINQGFDRSEFVDVNKDLADCNRVNHCNEEVVFEEFLRPIIKFKDRILAKNVLANKNPLSGNFVKCQPVNIFHIHGCGDAVHKQAQEDVGVIIGYGLGSKKDSFSCKLWRKNLFVHLWRSNKTSSTGDAFEGIGGGKYAGRDSNNLNQYFIKHDVDSNVESMQLEFPYRSRKDDQAISQTAARLINIFNSYIKFMSFDIIPPSKLI